MSERKPFKKFRKKEPFLTIEQKIEKFILRNSQNGYFTKVSTISYKFEISENRTWDIVGELLGNGLLESIHDEITGEMKLCETGQTYHIMDLARKRMKPKSLKGKKEKKSNG